jgi:protein-tyrosine-phosphatase
MTLIFACVGNICRSPMAEALARKVLADHPTIADEVTVASAGVAALDGCPPAPEAVEAMRVAFGLDIRSHRARGVGDPGPADLVLAMDAYTAGRLKSLRLRTRVKLLGEYAGTDESVDDPYGYPAEAYLACAEQLYRLVGLAIERLQEDLTRPPAEMPSRDSGPVARRRRIGRFGL